MKAMNIVCLVLWAVMFYVSINHVVHDEPVDPFMALGAMIVCVVHFLEKVIC